MKNVNSKTDNSFVDFTIEQQIIHQLLLYSSSIKNIGLFDGKMGIILSFAHYFEYSENPLYDDVFCDLMNEIAEEITVEHPIGFASGLSGIGWGVEYLIQKRFMEGDSLEVCEEIDRKIMEKDPRRITDYSIETGLGGILHYILAHIKGVYNQTGKFPFDHIYMDDLYQTAKLLCPKKEITGEVIQLADRFIDFYETKKVPDYDLSIHWFREQVEVNEENIYTVPMGLKNGLAGGLFDKLGISK